MRKLSVNANLNSPLSRPAKIIEFSRFSFVVRTPPLLLCGILHSAANEPERFLIS